MFSLNNTIKKNKDILNYLLIILLLGIYLTTASLYISKVKYGLRLFLTYIEHPSIFLLNFIPVITLLFVIYFITNRIAISFLLSTLVTFSICFINYFKIKLRNDPFYYEDFQYFSEAKNMMFHYQLNISLGIICMLILTVIIIVICFIKLNHIKINIKIRAIGIVLILIIFTGSLKMIYTNASIYDSLGDYRSVNYWNQTDRYIVHGDIYSFINSVFAFREKAPYGYNSKEMEKLEKTLTYSDIPTDKKVNVISFMLEAFNDFSKFDEIEFNEDIYKPFHDLEAEAYSGQLVTNIFAGGTADTERSFLTGYVNLPSFRKKTNSYVTYFKEQGYTVEGNHPCYDWFYNRLNINKNLGFTNYYFNENRYHYDIPNVGVAKDEVLLPDIIKLYNENKKTGKPYFNFSVTYQNHGPYSTEKLSNTDIVKMKDGYNQNDYNILNNYLTGISSTVQEINRLVEYFRQEQEPVVVILFGDHNPWQGDNNSVYKMLGINLDLGTEEGFYNYYCTPYVIWANDSAKKTLNNNFVGKGPDIGPYYLMNEFFHLTGYEGNQYFQMTDKLYKNMGLQAIRYPYYKVNNKLYKTLPEQIQAEYQEFLQFQYYWKNK